jgi:Zn-dependent protease with chaperone function
MGLASALKKIKDNNVNTKVNRAVLHLYFTNPLLFKNTNSLFVTHPLIDERIQILKKRGALYA